MAFDAGSVEAALTLNRNPFTAGLAAAKAQIDSWKRRNCPIECEVRVTLRDRDLKEIEAKLKKFGTIVAKATAEIVVRGRAEFDRLLTDLRWFDHRRFTATVDVNTRRATADVVAFRALLGTLNDQTVNLRANTRAFGNDASRAFDLGGSRFERLASLFIAGLPVIASAFTATVGAVGALASGLVIVGAGAGALAIVAVPAFKSVWKAANEGQAAINKLPPLLQGAGNAALGMQNAIKKLTADTQLMVGVGLANWFKAGTTAVGTLTPLVSAAAVAFGNAGVKAQQFFNSPWWQQFVDFLSRAIGPAVDMLFRGIFALIQIVGNLTRAFWDLGGSQILGMITSGLESFATWTEKIGQNKTFQEFMDAAVRSLPVVGHLLGDVLVFIGKLAVGLEPLGTLIIRVLNGIFDAVNSLPPETLGALAGGFGAMWLAIALGAGGPVGIAIGVLVGLGAILADLYTRNENFRTTINNLVDDLQQRWQPIWDTIVANFNQYILPAWENLRRAVEDQLMPALQRFGDVFMQQVWPAIQPFVNEITSTLIPAILNFLATLVGLISWLVDTFGPTVAAEMRDTITVFQGAFDTIAGALDIFTGIFSGNWTTFHQGLEETNRGFWTIIAGLFGTNLQGLTDQVQSWDRTIDQTWRDFWGGITGFFQSTWQTIKDIFHAALDFIRGDTDSASVLIGRAWARVANFFRDPINWVINTVLNDNLINAWNTVMGWIGAPGLNAGRIPSIPAYGGAFARGGPVSGGTPGKDSVLLLAQQGEYVLSRPAVNAMGGIGAVDRMHTAARGGVAGGPTFAQGGPIGKYALGGPVLSTVSMWSIFGGQVTSLLKGLIKQVPGVGGPIGDAINRIPPALINKVIEAAQKKLESIFQTIITGIFGGGGGTVSGGGGARAWIIAHESGGNPRAQNPTSSASGLYQMIDGTWRAYGGSTAHAKDASVAEQDAVADRYVAARYGSWENAQAFWQSHGYYDQGGWLQPGTTLATNNTGQPEAILTQAQLQTLTSAKQRSLTVQDVMAIVNAVTGSGSGSGGDVYNVMLPERASVRELADQLDFKRRVVSKGRYR